MMGGIMQVFISKDDRQCAGPEYFLWRAGGALGVGTVVLWTAPDAVLRAVITFFK